jgi:exodeoxyribonuclease VII small subunit
MSRKKAEGQALQADEMSFEKAMERLEVIVGEMESGELSLEDMMARFEEGQALVKMCAGKLNQVERRIEILVKEGDQMTAKPFDGTSEEEDDGKSGEGDEKGGGLPF